MSEAGLVIGTEPGAGEQVDRGDTVTLVVRKDPDLVEVPDVIGMRYTEVYGVLSAAGFEVVPDGAATTSPRTNPEPGSRARRGSEIVVELRR